MNWILLAVIVVFYAIRWRPSVFRRVERKNVSASLIFGEILILLLIIFQLTGSEKLHPHLPVLVTYFGLILSIFGAVIASIARLTLKRNYLPATAAATSKSLTTNGIYRIVRHPAYTGNFLAFIGFELAMDSFILLAVIPLLTVFVRQINKEERMLSDAYKQDWDDFTRKTPYKLVPFVY